VDDSRTALLHLEQVLGSRYDLRRFSDGTSVIEEVRAGALPDLVVLDWEMPGLSGPDVCRFVREQHDEADLPILMLTGSGETAAASVALEAGANDFVRKTSEEVELLARIRTLLLVRRLHQEARAAQSAAELRHAQLSLLFAQAPVAIAVLRGGTYVVDLANPRVCAIWGRTEAQVLGRPLFEAIPEARDQGLEGLLAGVLATGTPYVGSQLLIRLARGEDRSRLEDVYFNFVYQPMRDVRGDVQSILVVANDVTETVSARQKMETLARQSEERLKETLDVSGAWQWELDIASGEIRADLRVRALFGLAPGEPFTPQRLFELVHADDAARLARTLEDAYEARGDDVVEFECRTVKAIGGVHHWLDVRGQTYFDDGGHLVRLHGTALDVTARKHAEADRAMLLASVANQSVFGVAVLRGADLRFDVANECYRASVGGREVEGKPLLVALPELAGQGAEALILDVMRTGKPFTAREMSFSIDARGTGAPEPRFFDFTWQPIMSQWGGPDSVLVLTRDVTEAVHARLLETRLATEARERVDFEQQLIGIVSHDLRNPLSAIVMGAKLLGNGEGLSPRALQVTRRVQSSAQRAARMVNDLLDFTQARLGAGIPIEPRPADLGDVTRAVLEELQAADPARLVITTASGDLRGTWDPDRLCQVVQNLVGNALKYSPADTTVQVELRGADDEVTLAVHNQGAPIPGDRFASIFQPMQRGVARSDPTSRSVGLGLYIVKSLVEAHRGRIEVRSSAGEGTTFTVTLPSR
jgi:PAS domain S-box-containing protein